MEIAIPTTPSSSKRRYAPSTTFEEEDTENIDPSTISSPSKKSKMFNETPSKAMGSPKHFHLKSAPPSPDAFTSPLKPSTTSPRALRLPTSPSSRIRPPNDGSAASTPTVAGRSPKSKRIGILSRRRTSSSPFTRVDPPRGLTAAPPFSIDAALSGTIRGYSSPAPANAVVDVPVLGEANLHPASHYFTVHEDTEQETLTNLMSHSATTLDISDDESRVEKDTRGKENIPPLEVHSGLDDVASQSNQDRTILTRGSTSSRRSKPESESAIIEDRKPLGSLDVADFVEPEVEKVQVPTAAGFEIATQKVLPLSTPAEKRKRSESPLSLGWAIDDVVDSESVESVKEQSVKEQVEASTSAPAATLQEPSITTDAEKGSDVLMG
jgi:hypothetical protein